MTLDDFLSAIADDQLTPAQRRELGALLEASPANRRQYLAYLHLHAHLRREGAVLDSLPGHDSALRLNATRPIEGDGSFFEGEAPHTTSEAHWSPGRYLSLRSLSAAAVIVVGLIGIWASYVLLFAERDDRDTDLLPERPFLAVVTGSYGASWGDGEPLTPGTELYKGQWFELSDGLIELNVGRQARVVVEAPSRLGILDSQQLRIEYGTLAAEILASATDGLSVETPVGRAVDLGTQFVLRAVESGATHLEVHDGEVVWCAPHQDVLEGRRVIAGQAITINADSQVAASKFGSLTQAFKLLNDSYATALLAAGPRLYLPFAQSDLEQIELVVGRGRGVLASEGALTLVPSPFAPVSAVEHLTSAEQRDHALDFATSAESYLTIRHGLETLPMTGAYTIMLWFKADRIARQNIVGGTTHLGMKHKVGPQLRMHADGRLVHYIRTAGAEGKLDVFQTSASNIETGRWYHVAIAAESEGQADLFLNGRSVGRERDLRGQAIYDRYPDLQLGGASGPLGSYHVVTEPFTGVVDELAVFDRVLTREEVRRIYRAARLLEEGE